MDNERNKFILWDLSTIAKLNSIQCEHALQQQAKLLLDMHIDIIKNMVEFIAGSRGS